MSKLSYKTLLIILFSLLIAIVALWKFVLPKQKVSAAWWNDGWNYRKAITVTNSTSFDAINIPYKISLDTASLITAGKLQADADDIRIVDQNGKIVRSQVEKKTLNTSSSIIWFEATVKSNSSSSYYIYYGNPSATAPNFESDISIFSSTSTSATIEMKDGFGYTISNSNGGRVTNIKKNGNSLGIGGNIMYSASYPGNWWSSSVLTQTILNSTGPLFTEINYSAGSTGSYSIYGTNHKIFNNGFVETQISVTYNTSGSEHFYYYLSFDSGTRNSVWVDGSGTLIDQAANSGTLYETNLGQNWFGQRWTSTGNYGGTIITKNGSDWQYGNTSAQASYYQTNNSYSQSFTSGSSREVRFGVFAGNGGLSEMQQKGANYGGLNSSSSTEEVGGGPIAYWKFDEGIGTTALNSANSSYTSTITGATWQTEDQCLSGKCLYFNGSSYVNTNFGINRNISINPISVSMWVKPTSAGNYMFLSPNQGTDQRFYFSTYNGKWDMGIQNSGWGGSGSINVDLNKWSHIEIVTTGSIAYMYVNGKITSQKNYTSFTFPENLYIGIHGSSGAYGWVGYIDDVKIYPYARSAVQIKQDYNSRGSLNGSSVNLGVQSSTAPDLNSKLISYYKFDEGSGTTTNDSSPQKKSGSFVGTTLPTWSNNCKSGKCINFISTNANKISTNTSYNNSSEYTISAFIYPTSAGGNQYRIILGSAMGNNIDSGLVLPPGGGLNICYHNYMGSGDTNYCSTNNPIILNQWQYVALTFKDNNVNIYHNGINVRNVGIGKTSSSNYAVIGGASSYDYGGDRFFNGLIDEVKIYNTALTPDEIKQDYNASAAIQFGATNQTIGGTTTSLEYCIPGDTSYCASPVAEWKMDEKTGTTIKDISGNNNTGTFGTGSSAPTWTSGKIGAGLKFDGVDDYVSSGKDLLTSSPMTICTWFKLNTTSQDSAIIGNFASSYWTSYGKGFKYTNGTLYLMCENNNDKEVISTSLNDTNWHYACGIIQTSTGKLYLDGAQVASGDLNSDGYNYWTDIGAATWRNTENTKNFNGLIDHVKIYNYARTPAQIAYDYNKGAPVGWWKLDDCQGLTAFDSSGLGNNGAISIGPSGTQNSAGTCQVGTSAAWTNGAIGKYNSSLNFDGNDDYINLNDNFSNIYSSFSLSAWIRLRTGVPNQGAFFGNYSSYLGTYLARGTSDSRFRVCEGGTSCKDISISTSFVPLNSWVNLVGTYDGSTSKFYINGILRGQLTGITAAAWSNNFTIGKQSWSEHYTDGQIDDARIYNYALTSEQVKTVYNNGAVNFQ